MLDALDLIGSADDAAGELRCRYDRGTRRAVREQVAMILHLMRRIGRDGDAAGADDREIGDDPLRPVLGNERDPVAALEAQSSQTACQPLDLCRGLAPADRPIGAVALRPEEGLVATA